MKPKKPNAVATGRKQAAPAPSAAPPSAALAANQAPAAADPQAAGPREPERKQKRKPKTEPEARTKPEAPPQPSVAELAAIAAALSRTGSEQPDPLAERAFELWRACRKKLDDVRKRGEEKGLDRLLAPVKAQRDAAIAAIQWPSPKDYPIDASKLAYLAVPKLRGNQEAQTAAIRDWLAWRIQTERGQPVDPKGAEAGQMLAERNKRKLNEDQFRSDAEGFALWYAQKAEEFEAQASERRSAQGLKARTKRSMREAVLDVAKKTDKALPPLERTEKLKAIAKEKGWPLDEVQEAHDKVRQKIEAKKK